MPALGIELSGPTVIGSSESAAADGGCIRGFLWALAFEVASVVLVAALFFGMYRF